MIQSDDNDLKMININETELTETFHELFLDDPYNYDNELLLNRQLLSTLSNAQLIEFVNRICDASKKLSDYKHLFIAWLNDYNITGNIFVKYDAIALSDAIIIYNETTPQRAALNLYSELYAFTDEHRKYLVEIYDDQKSEEDYPDHIKLLHSIYSNYVSIGTEGISLDEYDSFIQSIDSNVKQKIKSIESLKSLVTKDNIIHFKLLQPLLNEVMQTAATKRNELRIVSVIQLAKFWDDYIDLDNNGDVVMKEWIISLNELDFEMEEEIKKKIFSSMDKCKNGFVDKQDFVLRFTTMKFEEPELIELQMLILTVLQDKD